MPGGRYTNLGDMCFWLRNPVNGRKDLYWQSRDNALLIKGGANYSYVRLSLALKVHLMLQF